MHATEIDPTTPHAVVPAAPTGLTRPGSAIVPNSRLRRGLATAAVMAGAGAMLARVGTTFAPPHLELFVGASAIAAVLLHLNHIGTQLVVRGVLWSSMIVASGLGFAALLGGAPNYWVMPAASAAALAMVGGIGLGSTAKAAGFTPKAFRKTFMAAIINSVAAVHLAVFTAVVAAPEAAVMALAAGYGLAQGVGGLSLYRLRTAGLGVLVAANIAVGALALAGVEGAFLFVPLAMLQTLMLLPVFGRIIRNLLSD